MTVGYFDCASGISGDMVLGALVDAGVPIERLSAAVESLGVKGVRLEARKVKRSGIAATKVDVVAGEDSGHRHLHDIERLIDESPLSEPVKNTAKGIFARVAAAEAKVHDEPVEKVHFHEVGAIDSICDIVGTAAGLEILGLEKCLFSPIPTGSGTVKAAHGVLPVPAPATAEILTGVPLAESTATGELATPTGAAIARELADGYGRMPAMRLESIGYGAGTRDPEGHPNVLRLFVGEESSDTTPGRVVVIEAALDDMTGEGLSFATRALFEAGALDVFVTPIYMKKGRPAQLITVLADPAEKEKILETLFRETTTFGARVAAWDRETLDRSLVDAESEYGAFRVKVGSYRGRPVSAAPEYDDAERIARDGGLPFRKVYADLQRIANACLDKVPRRKEPPR